MFPNSPGPVEGYSISMVQILRGSRRLAGLVVAGLLVSALSGCFPSQPGPRPASVQSDSPDPKSSNSAVPSTTAWNVPRDGGPETGAEGSVAVGTNGLPTKYTVASGDTQGEICHRFNVRWWQFTYADGSFVGTYPDLLPGEVEEIVEVPQPDNIAANNPLC